jgi:hypothetical protein
MSATGIVHMLLYDQLKAVNNYVFIRKFGTFFSIGYPWYTTMHNVAYSRVMTHF